jgi:hydrogenase-4 membrane subunit HyfE
LLTGGVAAFWLAVAIPTRIFWNDLAALHAGVAALLCLAPALVTLVGVLWLSGQSPEQRILFALGASGIRMFGVLLLALLLHDAYPFLRLQPGFHAWILVFYLFTLLLETLLIAQRQHIVEDRHGA